MDNIEIKKLTELDPNKIYVLKVKEGLDPNYINNIQLELNTIMQDYNIHIIVVNDNLEFVEVPKKEITNIILEDLDSFGPIQNAIKGMFR